MKEIITQFAKDQSGATAIEYGLIATLVSITIITAASTLGGGMESKFQYISDFIASS